MIDEDTMNNTNDAPATDLPPSPNGHGASNGTTHGETRQPDIAKDTAPSARKKNKKKRHQHDVAHAAKPVEPTAAATAAQAAPPEPTAPAEPAAPTEPTGPAEPISVSSEPAEPIDAQSPTEEPTAAPAGEPAAAQAEEFAAAPTEEPEESLRLRMKIWTDPSTSKRYLMPSAFMRDVVDGQPVSDAMYAYAMRDDSTKIVTLTAAEWNALPFFYFQEDGAAPRATARPVDDVTVSYTRTT